MQRKPGFPVANCNIKMPDGSMSPEVAGDDEWDPQHRRQQLINFGHSQWGFNNWNWMVTKQDLDFVELINGKYTAGVAAFINVTVKSFDIHRENVGYATSIGITKGSAIHRARKCAVTNALRETLLSFGGSVSTELIELLETNKVEVPPPEPDIQILKPTEPKNLARKEETNGTIAKNIPNVPSVTPIRPPPPTIKNAVNIPPPIAKAHPMPANLPPAANRPPLVQRPPPPPPAPHVRPNNEANDDVARAERKRRQKQAQEEFRLKQVMKQNLDKNELDKNTSSFDMLMAIPSQDIVIEEAGDKAEEGKRKSPALEGQAAKRRASLYDKADIVHQ
ncbi:DNA repair protein RAD52 homolog isoform X2 [Pieris rapae]|uniref:DNA repair protein RAD52 homolog isoform X2 n=1 Tax=Pieris rapae TaxID=64459 RepID=UPI001E27A217|nr:DNA repair protein RAD52 homolog isoform X2 [Pieris rapae]